MDDVALKPTVVFMMAQDMQDLVEWYSSSSCRLM
jgi:hypothetical protein